MSRAEPPDWERLLRQRDFYRGLLDLGSEQDIEPLLARALALIVEVTEAAMAYVELYDDDSSVPRYWKAHGLSDRDVASIRTSISRGIIGRTLVEGSTIETASAAEDPRFFELGSVRQHAIGAVLCVPVGETYPIGVIYLQKQALQDAFAPADRERAELFARQLAPLADRLLRLTSIDRTDHTLEARRRLRCPEIVGRSKALAQLLQSASTVAPLDVDVLITGPSGTGKSMLARAIHNNSPRAAGPFVELNCATVQEPLAENELFGAERGAHSTATQRRRGKVAAAEGGTLFLDEIAELSAGAQAKLLQLLETREYHALGSTTTERADVRIICATNAKLIERVQAKKFREDLYYRIHVMPIEVPGLDKRRDDIPELVEHFAAETCRAHRFPPITVSRRALAACREAAWPGHTRHLANAIKAAVIRAHGAKSELVHEEHIFPPSGEPPAGRERPRLAEAMAAYRKSFVLDALERNDWNIRKTARELGIVRSHLYTLINDHRLRDEGGDAEDDDEDGGEDGGAVAIGGDARRREER